MKRFKKLTEKQRAKVVAEVSLMIVAHRQHLWDHWAIYTEKEKQASKTTDPSVCSIEASDGFYGEAFGVMRGLNALGYGYFGSSNLNAVVEGRSVIPEHNLKWWFEEIVRDVLKTEGFPPGSSPKCNELLEEYRRLVRK